MKSKIFKSLVSIVLVLSMLFSMGIQALAATDDDIVFDNIKYEYKNYYYYMAASATDKTITEAKILPTILYDKEFLKTGGISTDGFADCTELKSVIVPSTTKEALHGAFTNCPKLESITIPKSFNYFQDDSFDNNYADNFTVYYGGTADEYAQLEDAPTTDNLVCCNNSHNFTTEYAKVDSTCKELGRTMRICQCGEIEIEYSTELAKCVDTDEDQICDFCGLDLSKYEKVSKGSLKYIIDLEEKTATVFKFDHSEKDVVIPSYFGIDGEKYTVTKIGPSAFLFSTVLETVQIPTSVTAIDGVAFSECSSLKSFFLPSTVQEVAYGVVYNDHCESISVPSYHEKINATFFYYGSVDDVYFYGTQEEWDAHSFPYQGELFLCNNEHDYSTLYSQTDATCLAPSETVYACKCGQVKIETGTELGKCADTDNDGICDTCGKAFDTDTDTDTDEDTSIGGVVNQFKNFFDMFKAFLDKIVDFFRGIGDIF